MPVQNYDVWIAISDGRTCPTCAALHGRIFPEGSGPIPVVDTHFGCRCRRVHSHSIGADEPPPPPVTPPKPPFPLPPILPWPPFPPDLLPGFPPKKDDEDDE